MTPYEVAQSFPIQEVQDVTHLRQHIYLVEQTIFRNELGSGFYAAMMNSKRSHNYENFTRGTSYNVGIVVLHDNLLWVATQNTSGTQVPGNAEFWRYADKFVQDEFNHVFENFIRYAIAYRVMASANLYRTVKSTQHGYQVAETNTSRVPTDKAMGNMNEQIHQDANTYLKLLDDYIQQPDKCELPVFAEYKPILDQRQALVKRKKSNQRYGFFTQS